MPFEPKANPDLGAIMLAQGISRAGEGLARAGEQIGKQFAQQKRLRDSYRVQGELLGFDKNMLDTMSADELMGLVEGVKLKRAMEKLDLEAQGQRLEMDYRRHQIGQLEAGSRFAKELAQFGPAEEQPMVLSPEELTRRSRPIDMRTVAGAAARSGYNMRPDDLAQLASAMEKIGRPRFTPGTIMEVPGMPEYVYGVQNPEGAGSFLPKRKAAAEGVSWKDAPEVPGYATVPGAKGEPKYVKIDTEGMALQDAAVANLTKTLAQLESMKARGVKTAKVSKTGGAVAGGALTWGDENIDDVIAGVRAELGAMQKGGAGKANTESAESTEGTEAKGKPKGMTDEQIVAAARKAIAGGKDPEAVKARLRAWGLDLK